MGLSENNSVSHIPMDYHHVPHSNYYLWVSPIFRQTHIFLGQFALFPWLFLQFFTPTVLSLRTRLMCQRHRWKPGGIAPKRCGKRQLPRLTTRYPAYNYDIMTRIQTYSMDSSIIYRFTMDYNSGLFKEYQVLCTIVLSMNNIMYSMTMIIMIIIPWILV